MAVRNLVYDGDKRLREKCAEIKNIDENIKKIADDMLDTMYKYDGIGLAACQIGEMIRMVTYDISYIEEDAKKKPMVLINPKIVWTSKTRVEVEEGCLSFPDVFKNVTRYEKVKMEYIGLDGKKRMISAKGIEAVVIQHELDHLDGIVFLDRIEK
jgi:peptide deformylase